MRPRLFALFASLTLLSLACGGDDSSSNGGAAPASGGQAASGGGAQGGQPSGSSGGKASGGSGQQASGGQSAQGGSQPSGGMSSQGGESASGGQVGGAGMTASGGQVASAGMTASGGAPASGPSPTIGGCAIFPPDDDWNTDISQAPADAGWTSRLQAMVGDINLHPDYGNAGDEHYGIPINVVPADQPPLDITFDWWPEESDPGPYPFPSPDTAQIEGGTPMACDGDCHMLVVQQGSCQLFEGYACRFEGGWHCGNGARFDLTRIGYGQRQKGFTSADAAGLAITPGILRRDEVLSGEVRHAIRFTTSCSIAKYVKPASHFAVPGSCDPEDPNAPPMGLRVRLRADYDISGFPQGVQVVLTAMKRYGMILADNGSNFFFQGERNLGWTEEEVEPLKQVPVSAFEVVAPPPLEP